MSLPATWLSVVSVGAGARRRPVADARLFVPKSVVVIPPFALGYNNGGIHVQMGNATTSPTANDIGPRASDEHVKEVIRQTEQQLRQLMAERREVTKRIRTVKQTITGLANIFDDVGTDPASLELLGRNRRSRPRGITRGCRQVLLDAGRPLTSRDICDELQRRAPALLDNHKDPMATINTILSRLVEYGEVAMALHETGQRAWIWSAPAPLESSSRDVTLPGQDR